MSFAGWLQEARIKPVWPGLSQYRVKKVLFYQGVIKFHENLLCGHLSRRDILFSASRFLFCRRNITFCLIVLVAGQELDHLFIQVNAGTHIHHVEPFSLISMV